MRYCCTNSKMWFYISSHVKADVLLFVSVLISTVSTNFAGFNENSTKDCKVALEEFAHRASEFTLCAIVHARPIKLCELCVTNYTNVQTAYNKILKYEDDSGAPCKKTLINVDRLEILENGYTYVQSLWQNGHCESCFEIVNGTMTDVLRNETRQFLDFFQEVNMCISHHYENGSYKQSVCKDCRDFYNNMNEVYETLKTIQGEENICIDIVDSVNTTRGKWSETLRCDRKEMKLEIELVAAFILVSLLPLVFYISTKHLTTHAATRLSQQKRLVQTFSVSSPSTSS